MTKRILLTGASGCVGHYITDRLMRDPQHELFLLVRDRHKLRIATDSRANVQVIQGDMQRLDELASLLDTIDCAILTATAWGGEATLDVNLTQTLNLMRGLNADRLEQVIYFSTASILDRQQQPLPEAGSLGTDYIRSKYLCHQQLGQLPIADRITTLFPTLVFGGDAQKPYSHISAGIPEVIKWIDLIRRLKADGSFQFIHAQDIAQVVGHLVDRPSGQAVTDRELVLGNAPLQANPAIAEICAYLGKPIGWQINLSPQLANFLIRVFRIQMAEWDRFCLDYRHFTYDRAVNPATFGLSPHAPTLSDLLKVSGVPPRA